LRCLPPTNVDSKYYAGKVVGDSPELCRGLDAYGFSHLKESMRYNVALSSYYPVGDIRRMSMGTPADVMSTMRKCWEECEPTSENIVDDILGFPAVLQKIIDARGCVVPDEDLRTGRRYVHSSESQRELKRKPRKRQRKSTMVSRVCHPDCMEAKNAIRDNTEVVGIFSESEEESEESEESEEEDGEEEDSGDNNGSADDDVVQLYEVGDLLRNPHGLGCVVLAYDGRGLYTVKFDRDGEILQIYEKQLRPRRGKTSCGSGRKPSFTYEMVQEGGNGGM
jgi:hypothetical protein